MLLLMVEQKQEWAVVAVEGVAAVPLLFQNLVEVVAGQQEHQKQEPRRVERFPQVKV
jgi:hypothetical protein